MEPILLDTTDRSILVFIPDAASTDGSGKTGLAHTVVTVSYTRVETDNDVVVTNATSSLNALANLTDAHNDWGWKEVSSTLAPGLYRLDVADAVFAAGAWYAVVYVMVTSGEASATPKAFQLVAYNPLDGVRLGLTALPNAAAEAAGGLYTRGTGAGQVDQDVNGTLNTNSTHVLGTPLEIADGVAQAGGATSITLAAGSSSVTDYYRGNIIRILEGTGADQSRVITAYNGTTKVATVHRAWAVVPGADSQYYLEGNSDTNVVLWRDSQPSVLDGGNVPVKVYAYDTNMTPLQPTVAGRTLDVSTTGEGGADLVMVNGSTTGVAGFKESIEAIVSGTVDAGSTTTSIVTSSLTPAAAVTNQFVGRVVIFRSATTTTNLRGQASNITASTSGGVLTVTALTTAPVSGDVFVIV